jgi:uncharacterized membrane protein YkvA (DUF1232 family)
VAERTAATRQAICTARLVIAPSGPTLTPGRCTGRLFKERSMWKRLTMLWWLVKTDARLLWHALRHPDAPRWLKFGAAGVVLYVISPIDLIPDVIPIIGIVDDVVLVPLAIRWLLARLPAHIRADVESRLKRPVRTA